MKVLIDTGPLVALINRRDAFHSWSLSQADQLKPPFFTCEAVISEAHFLLGGIPMGCERLIRLVNSGHLDLSYSYAEHADRVGELMIQYKNIPMSFADACLVSMTELQAGRVFTVDNDFRIYRRNGNKAIDVLLP